LILVVGIGGINFGYAIGVFNSLQVEFVRVFQFKEEKDADKAKTAMTTISSIGMAIGALTSGPLTRFGKKNCIYMTNGLVILA
jgi:predicted MFS family arabinose efflux permease